MGLAKQNNHPRVILLSKQKVMHKQYVIVGGSKGIGKSIVANLLSEGHTVYNISRTDDTDFHLHNPGTYHHIEHDVLSGDLPKDELPQSIDGLAYCPGSINLKPFRSLSIEDYKSDFDINVLGVVTAIKSCLTGLKKSEGMASVVLFSTVAVGQGMPFHASIAASKGAVEGLVKSLASELAPRIRVNAVAPSLTDTPLASGILSSPERKESSNQRHPLKRYGQPEDIANAAYYLLSEQSSWVTGQILNVDGGMSAIQ